MLANPPQIRVAKDDAASVTEARLQPLPTAAHAAVTVAKVPALASVNCIVGVGLAKTELLTLALELPLQVAEDDAVVEEDTVGDRLGEALTLTVKDGDCERVAETVELLLTVVDGVTEGLTLLDAVRVAETVELLLTVADSVAVAVTLADTEPLTDADDEIVG